MSLYHRPDTLESALAVLQDDEVRIAAGCTDLFPATEARALEGPILDITAIEALRGVEIHEDGLRIGATTTWSDIIRADLPPAFDMLKAAAREVGSVQIQNSGTIAGNLCNASPAADGVPCLMALDAEVELASGSGHRRLPLADFLTGPRQTALGTGEMLVAIHIPRSACAGVSAFQKLGARKYLVISIAMAAVRLVIKQGTVTEAAISVGSCSAVAARLPELEQALAGQAADVSLLERITPDLVIPALSPIDDIRADAAYRGQAATELVLRAIRDLVNDEAQS